MAESAKICWTVTEHAWKSPAFLIKNLTSLETGTAEMSLRDQVEQQVNSLQQSQAVPSTIDASDATGLSLSIEISAIDSMSVEFTEMSIFVPSLQNAAFDKLKQWASDLSSRITYLIENIGPLEFDPAAGQVLIRSTPPAQLASGTEFFEIMLSSQGNGTFTLKRFRSVKGTPGRSAVEMRMTTDILLRLVDDLIATIP